ncbi:MULTISPECIES: tetratricopeptide repeat protein [Rhodomicrobium]|uniref:tetratricopeptide repeat protein n=1 Tax=Rhodomicrobium TaxID=1068 RepID=UPI0014839D36|nr:MULTISPECIES: tetratricopeptide repeat protein [Rhodomicrobium]
MALPLYQSGAQAASPRSAEDDLSVAEEAFKAGRPDTGVAALQRAADQGSLAAMLRLGRIFEEGQLVKADKLKACRLYSAAAERYSDADRFTPSAPLVAEAFRRCAACYAAGLSVPGWDRNMNMAAQLYFQSGVMLDDSASLLELSKLYLTGDGAAQNTTLAIHLLETAARKRYPPAQAYLGWLMWEGKLMKQRQGPGLALLILANENAEPEDMGWIRPLVEDALLMASKELEQEARDLVEKYKAVYPAKRQSAPPLGDPQLQRQNMLLDQVAQGEVPPPVRSPAREAKNFNFNLAKDTDHFGNQTTGAHLPPGVEPNQKLEPQR